MRSFRAMRDRRFKLLPYLREREAQRLLLGDEESVRRRDQAARRASYEHCLDVIRAHGNHIHWRPQ